MKRQRRVRRLKNRKRKTFITLLLLSTLVFAQALVIAKFYTEKQEKKYTVNLVQINTERDSIDYPQLKNDLENIDDFVKDVQGFLRNKNISDSKIDQLKKDSLSNDIYLAKTSNRYSQYLVDLQNKLMGIPFGLPTEGYISSQFGKRKNRFVAVRDVSFQIYKGETFGLVGESGSGKTTIGRAIIRLNETAGGNIIFDGKKINGKIDKKLDKEVTKRVQMIFQDPMASLNERAKVDYIVSEGLYNLKTIKMKKKEKKK